MTLLDFQTLVGSSPDEQDLVPVALLLKCGYACVGHYNSVLNQGLTEACILLNAQIIQLGQETVRGRANVDDFSEFLEEVVAHYYGEQGAEIPAKTDFGKVVPLASLSLHEIAVVYPVSRIAQLLQRIQEHGDGKADIPAMFDLDKSEILAVLRTKLW